MTLSNLAKQSMPCSMVWPICNSWAYCCLL